MFLWLYEIKFVFFFYFQANSEAARGVYAGGVAGAAGGQSLFVANHSY